MIEGGVKSDELHTESSPGKKSDDNMSFVMRGENFMADVNMCDELKLTPRLKSVQSDAIPLELG